MSAYVGSPYQPFFLVIHARRCIVNSTCDNCPKENRGIDLYRMINGAECTGLVMSCHRHPSYAEQNLSNHRRGNQSHKRNVVVNTVEGMKQMPKQFKKSFVEFKSVFDDDVHRNRDGNRLYAVNEDQDDDDDNHYVNGNNRHNGSSGTNGNGERRGSSNGNDDDDDDTYHSAATGRTGGGGGKGKNGKESERSEDETEPVILEAE